MPAELNSEAADLERFVADLLSLSDPVRPDS
jgi:hypothetical protein